MIFRKLAHGLSRRISGVTQTVVDKAEYAPTTDALFGQSDPLLSLYGNVSLLFPPGSRQLSRDELQRCLLIDVD